MASGAGSRFLAAGAGPVAAGARGGGRPDPRRGSRAGRPDDGGAGDGLYGEASRERRGRTGAPAPAAGARGRDAGGGRRGERRSVVYGKGGYESVDLGGRRSLKKKKKKKKKR